MQIAVIDDTCMWHPAYKSRGGGSLYEIGGRCRCAALRTRPPATPALLAQECTALPCPADRPFDEREEEARRAAEYKYFESETQKLGYPYRAGAWTCWLARRAAVHRPQRLLKAPA